MKIVFVAAEMSPFAKVGGLADVLGDLPNKIAELGHQVYVVLPRYHCVDGRKFSLKKLGEFVEVSLGQETEKLSVKSSRLSERLEVFFLEHPYFFDREGIYGTSLGDYEDNDKRFIMFSKASLELLKLLGIKPDIIHCHDWQTGLVPAFLKLDYQDKAAFQKTKSFFTIHNLAYQGNFPPDTLALSGFDWKEFSMQRMEFYGKFSFLKTGLVYSDVVTTVSETYAKEIQTEEFGCGLEGVLQRRNEDLYGILNGIDFDLWNPETDKELETPFSSSNMEAKAVNKAALQKEFHLTVDPQIPLLGIVTRLVDQKGIDLLLASLEKIHKRNLQFVLLGKGMNRYHNELMKVAQKYAGSFSFNLKFDEKLARRIYASSDIFLMPSVFEPCGLGQIISMRYGTIPLVREIGGLADTVTNYDTATGEGNGFVFLENTSEAFLSKLDEAVEAYRNKAEWNQLIHNAMNSDFSVQKTAQKYIELYKNAKRKTVLE